MSQLTNPNPHKVEENQKKEFSHSATPVRKFSNSLLSNIKQEAKKLKKSLSIKNNEALDKAAVKRGFKSFNDARHQIEYWESLPTVYIYISKRETLHHTKEVFSKLAEDDQSKSIRELIEDSNSNMVKWLDQTQSFSKHGQPVTLLDNQKFGIRLLNEKEKDEFFADYSQNKSSKFSKIDRNEDYLFKFVYYKLYPEEQTKIRDDLKALSKKLDYYKFSDRDVKEKITNLIDNNLKAYLTTETYTENTFIYEAFDVFPHAYIVNNEYYNAVDLHDASFDQSVSFSDND